MTEKLQWMLSELLAHRLEVAKFRSRDGGYTRAAVSQNAPWYQTLCASHTRSRKRYRKHRTIIKRGCTIRALNRMIAGNMTGVYADRIREVLETALP